MIFTVCVIYDNSKPFRYPEARQIQRRIIYHAGPTNSGKTYHALQAFLKAKSGTYCGPLRLLANEVHSKANTEVRMKKMEKKFGLIIS